jgi:cation transport ATPase
LLGNDLLKLVEALRIARRCRAIIRQNFAGTLALKEHGGKTTLTVTIKHISKERATRP